MNLRRKKRIGMILMVKYKCMECGKSSEYPVYCCGMLMREVREDGDDGF